jgi:hypothetical protein
VIAFQLVLRVGEPNARLTSSYEFLVKGGISDAIHCCVAALLGPSLGAAPDDCVAGALEAGFATAEERYVCALAMAGRPARLRVT